jgi:NAD(P)-dependent dehydrogenase (short-subunit alcohol dehydrogenase family)
MASRMDIRMALNEEILAQGAPAASSSTPFVVKKKSVANSSTTEWNVASTTGTFQGEHWPSHLPKPPSRKNLMANGNAAGGNAANPNAPSVIVFNANTQEGSSMVRVLAEKGMRVTAVVRVFTSKNAKQLIKLQNVTVKVADLNNRDAVLQAAAGCQQAFLVTKYWERFENAIEEDMAKVVLTASAEVGIQRLILATFEDTQELRLRKRKSQLMPTVDGRIFPKFDGMLAVDEMGKVFGVQITHMMTSYLDDGTTKKSLILIRGGNGKILTQSHVQDSPAKAEQVVSS